MALPPPSADLTSVVTGASSGIGAEIACELARRGHGVTLVARREGRLRALAAELTSRHGVRAEVVPADLADPADRGRILDVVTTLGLGVSMLVNNAGISTFGSVCDSDPDAEIAMVRTDVEAVVDLCSRFVPQMVRRGGGSVLNVASTAAYQPLPGQAGYAAAKAFVLSYSQAMRAELRSTGVTVTTLCPGPVDTEFGADAELDAVPLPRFMWVPAARIARLAVDAAIGGRPVVIPGLANKVTAAGARAIPRRILLPVIARRHPAL